MAPSHQGPAAARLRAGLAAHGVPVTDEQIDATRQRVAGLPPISDRQHADALAWLDADPRMRAEHEAQALAWAEVDTETVD